MPRLRHPVGAPFPRQMSWYNAIPNVFWSAVCLAPLGTFCYRFMERRWLYTFGVVGLLAYLIPTSRLRHLQLSARPAPYRHLRVHLVNRFTQNGTYINRLFRRNHPASRLLLKRAAMESLVRKTYQLERFHLAMLLFFLFSALYAFAGHYPGWALAILFGNVVYNLYPMWLQQYIRLRVRRFSRAA